MSIVSSILDFVNGQAGLSVINDFTGSTVWTNAKCASLEIDSESANTDHPTAAIVLSEPVTFNNLSEDNIITLKIIKPSRVRMILMCPDLSTVEHILTNFNDTTFTCSITTKSVIISSMCPTEVSIDQVPDILSATKLTILLEQAVMPVSPIFLPLQGGDASTYGEHIQAPTSLLTQTVSGLSTRISSLIAHL
jgi:hypothetical protein